MHLNHRMLLLLAIRVDDFACISNCGEYEEVCVKD